MQMVERKRRSKEGDILGLDEAVAKIVEEAHLSDKSYFTIAKWCLENKDDAKCSALVSAVHEEQIIKENVKTRSNNTIEINRLEHSEFLIYLANSYSEAMMHDKAIELFEQMEKKGCTESTMLNDYGRALLRQMLFSKTYDREKWDHARQLIFKAFDFDKKVSKDCYKFPAYKNLSFLRAVEASYYLQQNDPFTAFVLAWVSIEMTLYRIWRQYLQLKNSNKIDDLSRWNSDAIIEMLYIGNVENDLTATKKDFEALKALKPRLDTLKGVRNHLLHGENDNPTNGEARSCTEIALKIVPFFQSLDSELATRQR